MLNCFTTTAHKSQFIKKKEREESNCETMSDDESVAAPSGNVERQLKKECPKINRKHWKENGDKHCRVSNPDFITVCVSATEHYCQGCDRFDLTHDHSDGKCRVSVACQRLNYAYKNWADEGGPPNVVINEVTLRYMFEEKGLDFDTIILNETPFYRPNMPLGKNSPSFHEEYMKLDEKWRVPQEPYCGTKGEIRKNTKKDMYYYAGWQQKERREKAERDATKKKLAWAGICTAFQQYQRSLQAQLKDMEDHGRMTRTETEAIIDECLLAAHNGLSFGRDDGTNSDISLTWDAVDDKGKQVTVGSYKKKTDGATHCGYKPIEGAPNLSAEGVANRGIETTRNRKKPKLMAIRDLYELYKAEQKKKKELAEKNKEKNKETNNNTPKVTNVGENNTNTITPPGTTANRSLQSDFEGTLK